MAISDFAFLAPVVVGWLFWEWGKAILYLYWARRSRAWPSTQGRILKAITRPGNRRLIHFHTCVAVRYCYSVNGMEHEAGVRGYHCNSLSADDFVAQHSPGSEVEVFYDPRDPRRAVLERGGSMANMWAVGGLGILVGCVVLAVWLREIT
jgi:hypothetical protein